MLLLAYSMPDLLKRGQNLVYTIDSIDVCSNSCVQLQLFLSSTFRWMDFRPLFLPDAAWKRDAKWQCKDGEKPLVWCVWCEDLWCW